MKEKIENIIGWVNKRLSLVNESLTIKQQEYLTFSFVASDLLSKDDVRNKLSPIKNLLSLLDDVEINCDAELKKLIKLEIIQCEESIKYLSK